MSGKGMQPATRSNRAVHYTSEFKGDLKRAKGHKKCNLAELIKIMKLLERRQPIPASYKDHAPTHSELFG